MNFWITVTDSAQLQIITGKLSGFQTTLPETRKGHQDKIRLA
jgi:hypothetical protein